MARVIISDPSGVLADEPPGGSQLGALQPAPASGKTVIATIVADDGSALRRTIRRSTDLTRLSADDVTPTEFPAGIDGQAWDPELDGPAAAAIATLARDGRNLATRTTDLDGRFSFELSSSLPLTPGRYEVAVAAGAATATRVVDLAGHVVSIRLGRVEVARQE